MTDKFTSSDPVILVLVRHGQDSAAVDYRTRLEEAGQNEPIKRYDFNRGFEYGVQWGLKNIDWLNTHGSSAPESKRNRPVRHTHHDR
jgi:hypothetical protein